MPVNTLTDSRCRLVKPAEETRRMKASGEDLAAKRKVAREVRVLNASTDTLRRLFDNWMTTKHHEVSALYRTDGDELLLVLTDGDYQWNAANGSMTLRWRRVLLDMPGITAATAYKAVHRQGTVTLRH